MESIIIGLIVAGALLVAIFAVCYLALAGHAMMTSLRKGRDDE